MNLVLNHALEQDTRGFSFDSDTEVYKHEDQRDDDLAPICASVSVQIHRDSTNGSRGSSFRSNVRLVSGL